MKKVKVLFLILAVGFLLQSCSSSRASCSGPNSCPAFRQNGLSEFDSHLSTKL